MKLIAESGSTKTVWVSLDASGDVLWTRSSIGLNPFFVDSNEVESEYKQVLEGFNANEINNIHFYGASCSSPQRNKIISDGLIRVSKNAVIDVNHDLLAAARATCKTERGIACILGTGSNSCEFDGKQIIDNVPSMGFMVGDEGSGSAIGRRLVRAWIYREMPEDLKRSFVETFDLSKEYVLDALYNKPKPNRFLASLSRFCAEVPQHELIQSILIESFEEFIDRHVLKYESAPDFPIHFVGSIAHYYRKELKIALNNRALNLGLIVQNPIEELVKYHSQSEV